MTRIVGGRAGGRRLATPRGRGTRPTSERVREGLFSTLDSLLGSLSGRGFVDLYAGSGAVGLEAASRGAAPVLLVERDAAAVATLRSNAAALGLDEVDIRASPVARVLEVAPARPFDVVFLDPPYADDVTGDLTALAANGWLTSDAVVVVERATRSADIDWPEGLRPERSRRYGDTVLSYGLWYGRRS